MLAGYAKSKLMSDTGLSIAGQYQGWALYNTQPYVSDTHGGRIVNNYGNRSAKAYGKFEHSPAPCRPARCSPRTALR